MTNEQLQALLDIEAEASNAHYSIKKLIIQNRGDATPVCWGDDDCSTEILSRCPWRVDCGDQYKVKYGK